MPRNDSSRYRQRQRDPFSACRLLSVFPLFSFRHCSDCILEVEVSALVYDPDGIDGREFSHCILCSSSLFRVRHSGDLFHSTSCTHIEQRQSHTWYIRGELGTIQFNTIQQLLFQHDGD